MLTTYKPNTRTRLIEKILVNDKGEHIRVVFLVALINGEIKIKPISAVHLSTPSSLQNLSVLYFPTEFSRSSTNYHYVPDYKPTVSPYMELSFFNSQPTRAPSVF